MATPEPHPQVIQKREENKLINELIKTGGSILAVYSVHYATAKSYNLVCVPGGVTGFLFGFVTTASPWCKFMLEIMKVTENQYSTIILIVLSRLFMQALGV
jgi:hypothetical protein